MKGRVGVWLLLLALVLGTGVGVRAAPLAPGDPAAREAVDLLRRLGLMQEESSARTALGRYEAAALLARVLESLPRGEARDGLRKVAQDLAPELEALGFRLEPLEEEAERLGRRVDELERFTLRGRLISRVISQDFTNRGNPTSGPNAQVDYDRAVGTLQASNLLPFGSAGVLPVIDMVRGRPLTDGRGFATALLLDATVRVSEDLEAELGLSAYSSQGDSVVDAVWGPTPPYLSNPFTGSQGTSAAHVPFTGAALDHLRLRWPAAGLTATAGTFRPTRIAPTVYLGEANPTVGLPRVLDSFGFHVQGEHRPFEWEVFGTRLADGNPGAAGQPYRSDALGAALRWNSEAWTAGLSLLRAGNQSGSAGPLTVGEIANMQAPTGALYTDWVNPPGFLVGQLGGPGDPRVAGAGSTSDVRPVPGVPGSDALGFGSTFGPQGISMAGLSLERRAAPWRFFADWAGSDYRPNRNSRYNARGALWRAGAAYAEDGLDLALEYRSTDPDYDPFVLSYPSTAASLAGPFPPLFRVYHRLPSMNQFWHLYSLHNTEAFPHNRRGLWASGSWRYEPDGQLRLAFRSLEQVRTSLQDVRLPAGTLGAGTPDVDVLGHRPGFLDVVFREYSPLSFTPSLDPREDVRGRATSWKAELSQVFTGTPWRLDLGYETWAFRRPTGLAPAQGGSQNAVDLRLATGRIAVGRALGDDVLLTAGYERGEIRGHYDPAGHYNPVALATGSTSFRNWDSVQHIPFVEVDWVVGPATRLGLGWQSYTTVDRVPTGIFPGAPGGRTSTAHPFSWSGQRLESTLEIRF